jgi:translation initiation factor IF-3
VGAPILSERNVARWFIEHRRRRCSFRDTEVMRVSADPRINDRIRAPQVRLVGHDGQQIGVVPTADALRRAREVDLDLVEVAPQADPPVCRIMDYGKYKYERDIRQKEARRKQARTELKEIKFRPKIDPHDYGTKKGHVVRFLRGGNKVKITIMFRGREMSHTELGRKILDRLVADLGEMIVVEMMPKQEGRNMVMVISPNKRHMEQMARESARAASSDDAAPMTGDEPQAASSADEG